LRAIKVKLKDAEKARKYLVKNNGYNHDYHYLKDKEYIYFPILESIKSKFEVVDKKLKKNIVLNYEDLIKKIIPKKLHNKIPMGFDSVGEIVILEVNDDVKKYEKDIADLILKTHNNIKTVVKKASIHSGVFRTRKYKILAGKKSKETIHKENNVKLKLNIEDVYYSPRSSNERLRIINLVKKGEKILVMFSGIGPFTLEIAKNTDAKNVVGIELNPEAHKYAMENLKLNKINNCELINGDATKHQYDEEFDRVLMPLPKTGEKFLKDAFRAVKKNGVIHFYDFLSEEEFPNKSIDVIQRECKKAKLKCKILDSVKCGNYSPRTYRTCVDFKVLS
jgi:tRNA (guanine37-N1)-methyltransferase